MRFSKAKVGDYIFLGLELLLLSLGLGKGFGVGLGSVTVGLVLGFGVGLGVGLDIYNFPQHCNSLGSVTDSTLDCQFKGQRYEPCTGHLIFLIIIEDE